MSPSTKNLKERIEEIGLPIKQMKTEEELLWVGVDEIKESVVMLTTQEKISALLSSELSLAVKGLRESVEKVGVMIIKGDPAVDAGYSLAVKHSLESFDSKAKEILGESS